MTYGFFDDPVGVCDRMFFWNHSWSDTILSDRGHALAT